MLVARDSVAPVFMFTGVYRRVLNTSDTMMVVEVSLAAGSTVPNHTHPHEQIGYLSSGRIRFQIGDEERLLEQGDSWLIPSGIPHTVVALVDSVAIDIFSPPREDFLQE
jgi:quercetin dioxygenase-like cupin family protein